MTLFTYVFAHFVPRQENDRLHIELDRVSRDIRDPRDMRDPYSVGVPERRGRSPDPMISARNAVEIADLQDKLDKSQTELRRAQAELRLNQGDYERSHVELEQMQEKVRSCSTIVPELISLITVCRRSRSRRARFTV